MELLIDVAQNQQPQQDYEIEVVDGQEFIPGVYKVPSLQILSAKQYAKSFKKLPSSEIAQDYRDIIQVYLPPDKNSIVQQYANALKLKDEERAAVLKKSLIKYKTLPVSWSFKYPPLRFNRIQRAREVQLKKHDEEIEQDFGELFDLKDFENKKQLQEIQKETRDRFDKRECICSCGAQCCCIVATVIFGICIIVIRSSVD